MREILVAQFRRALSALGGEALVASGAGEATAAVLSALRARSVREVLAWDEPFLERIGLPEAAREAGISWLTASGSVDRGEIRTVAARAGAGVTGANFAVAETGTLALLGGVGRPRTTHLLPPLHVAVLPLAQLLATTSDLFRELADVAKPGRMPGALQLVTGPSRSADIEDVLIRKMHGPGELMVVLVEQV